MASKTLKIALTGNIGCGKSVVTKMFQKYGLKVIDSDKQIHYYYTPGHQVFNKVVASFGSQILSYDGNIDRKKLGAEVFSDPKKLRILEKITHKQLTNDLEELTKDQTTIVEVPLLMEKCLEKDYDLSVVVYAPYELCKKRALADPKRKSMSKEEFDKRWKLQMPIDDKARKADYVIDNSKSLKETEKQVQQFIERYLT
jgi:dephospho-CoA kinase